MIYLTTILAIAIGFVVAALVYPRPKQKRKRKPRGDDAIFDLMAEARKQTEHVTSVVHGYPYDPKWAARIGRARQSMRDVYPTAEEAAEALSELGRGSSDD